DGENIICLRENDLNILVNKQYAIDENYEPDDLKFLTDYGIRDEGKNLQLRELVLPYLKKMQDDLDQELGTSLYVLSAFRNFKIQTQTKNKWLSLLGLQADKLSAEAGHSEHQLGTTVDFGLVGKSGMYTTDPEWFWLANNAYKYGFVMTYRENNQDSTGYNFEPWHWRFVGIELATKIHDIAEKPEDMYLPKGCYQKKLIK
ncbi:M15 family metallopeptidase, partial [Candidatus Beckwithbacteria bacterium]|nr:M15 family metallopeptidase [Candidatus Beckwithbacteria bacterium]